MGFYSFPPPPRRGGGGGGGGPGSLVSTVLSFVFFLALFTTPLGRIFFAITNSLLLLTFLTPVVLYVAFQAWQFFNTVSAPCPTCSAPLTVMKQGGGGGGAIPSVCMNCGSFVQANAAGDGIELAVTRGGGNRGDVDVVTDDTGGVVGGVFGNSIFDSVMGDQWGARPASGSSAAGRSDSGGSSGNGGGGAGGKSKSKIPNQKDIIDAEIEDEDKPFQ